VNAPPRRAALAFIFVTIALDVVSFGIIIPVLPRLIEGFFPGDTARAAHYLGLFGTVWAGMQFICSPILGILSDRFGRRPILIASTLGLGVDYLFMAVAPTVGLLFIGRLISGMTAAGFSTATAYIADVTPPERRAHSFGLVGAAFGLGFVVGPAIGGILGGHDPRLPFWVAGAMTVLNACYGALILPESLPAERRAPIRWARANPVGALAFLREHPGLLGLAGAFFLYNLAQQSYAAIYVLYAEHRFGWSTTDVGWALAGVGVLSALVQGGLIRRVLQALGQRRTMLLGLAGAALGFTLYGLAFDSRLFAATMLVGAVAGFFNPAVQGIMTTRVAATAQGQLQGANASLLGITGLIGPGLYTGIFAWSLTAGGTWLAGAGFLVAGLTGALALGLGWWATREPHPAPAPEPA
jgi:DHA1 family tetracycline resistance protein-like MFS transporter